jgi:hypothetical protein
MANQDFSGLWQFTHWYPTSDDSTEESGKYQMRAQQTDNSVVLESVADNKKEAYMMVRLIIDGTIATGTWHESAEMHGPFQGAMYSGAGQLIISSDGQYMDGVWAGAGMDHANEKPRIYTGRWELKRLG